MAIFRANIIECLCNAWSSLAWKIPRTKEPDGLQPAAAKSLQLCPTLCDPIDGSPPGSSVPGILQARILGRVASSFSNACMHAKSLQLCPTLCDPMDSSTPGSSVHGVLKARVLEWVAISFSRQQSMRLQRTRHRWTRLQVLSHTHTHTLTHMQCKLLLQAL